MQVSRLLLDQLEFPLMDDFTALPPGRGEALRPELPHTVRGLRQPQRLQIPREVQEQVSSRHSQSSLQNPSFGQLKIWLFTFTADAFGPSNFRNPEIALIVDS